MAKTNQMFTYDCDTKKNIKCKKNNCNKEYCTCTTEYKYAKKTVLNFIKKIINKVKGNYIYEWK